MNYKQLLMDNFTYKTSYIARHVHGMNVKETKDYIAVDCGLPADTFNIITLLNNDVTEDIEKLYKVINNYNKKKFPMCVWFWDNSYEYAIKNELIKLGLKEAEQNIAMVADLKTIQPTIKMPEGFTIQRASSLGQIKKFGETLANLFGTSKEEMRGQGFGSTMFNYLLQEAKELNVAQCVLQASPDGITIYKKAGFQSVGQMTVFENRHLFE
ncbi:TPA: GNAT family N-acetyltransferase [Bacillus tropicus]|uniref:GNAT family N-acetyltransferase n=1 Tax=Bacillus tropicus TaxID=2026188 RepID=UPI00003CC58E|nr:GNAT family N-acetyltransferase [Bacillus tropicus]AIY76133.1 acetyltransferase domain protein [Bacillus cereus]AJI06053.1 acetyltransferase domain protein [Bacillus cereus G9241]EAL11117.1 acetyltransferase [Bacillus cereus G9241]KDB41402.1 acetyltransferase [Bacillus cereus]QPS49005.1 GNAT family N-acetyltransferase [Bacillus tropicus]